MSTMDLGKLEKGDLILVRWTDASDVKGTIAEHEARPDIHVKDWGLYLGVSGKKRRFLLIGKDVVEVQNEWGVTRIPLELIEEVVVLMPREQVIRCIAEIQILARRIRTRRYRRERIA